MKSNNLLTYVLYGLLGAFILAAGYYACQRQKEKKELEARDAAELEETLREMGYAAEDTIAGAGSSFVNKDSLNKPTTATPPAGSKNGNNTETAGNTKTSAPKPTNKPSSTTAKPNTSATTKGSSAIKGPGTGRWAVRAGTFSYMEGARRRLEEVIKAGYTNAEISKTKDGNAAVIILRTNDKNAALRMVDELSMKGIDAAVFDRNN